MIFNQQSKPSEARATIQPVSVITKNSLTHVATVFARAYVYAGYVPEDAIIDSDTTHTIEASSLTSGTLQITENGVYNVSNYSNASVNVSGSSVETAQITLYLQSETAWYTNSSMQVCQAQVDFDIGQIVIDDFAPIGTLVVVIDNLRPSLESGVTLVTSSSRNGYYIYKVTG